MCARYLLPAVVLLTLSGNTTAQTFATEEAVERLLATAAMALDPALPDQPFGAWFDAVVPARSGRFFELATCADGNGDGRRRACLTIEVDIVSRHRNLHLQFERDSLAFVGGVMAADELEGEFPIDSLASLPRLLRRGMRPFPLTCPANTQAKFRESYAGLFEWCEDASGKEQGPARAWFSTGIYLLHRGQYAGGEKVGDWIECNRFERCAFNSYKNGARR